MNFKLKKRGTLRKDHKETMGFLKFNEYLQKTPYSIQVSYNLYLFL